MERGVGKWCRGSVGRMMDGRRLVLDIFGFQISFVTGDRVM
jgi:hypothetical protein